MNRAKIAGPRSKGTAANRKITVPKMAVANRRASARKVGASSLTAAETSKATARAAIVAMVAARHPAVAAAGIGSD
jgi:hypothetical protein